VSRLWPFALLNLDGRDHPSPRLYERRRWTGEPLASVPQSTLADAGTVNPGAVLVLFLWAFQRLHVPYALFGPARPARADLVSFLSCYFHEIQNGYKNFTSVSLGRRCRTAAAVLLVVHGGYLAVTSRRRHDAESLRSG